jgi:hypothetical protein
MLTSTLQQRLPYPFVSATESNASLPVREQTKSNSSITHQASLISPSCIPRRPPTSATPQLRSLCFNLVLRLHAVWPICLGATLCPPDAIRLQSAGIRETHVTVAVSRPWSSALLRGPCEIYWRSIVRMVERTVATRT